MNFSKRFIILYLELINEFLQMKNLFIGQGMQRGDKHEQLNAENFRNA
jgi:hypothetical protein